MVFTIDWEQSGLGLLKIVWERLMSREQQHQYCRQISKWHNAFVNHIGATQQSTLWFTIRKIEWEKRSYGVSDYNNHFFFLNISKQCISLYAQELIITIGSNLYSVVRITLVVSLCIQINLNMNMPITAVHTISRKYCMCRYLRSYYVQLQMDLLCEIANPLVFDDNKRIKIPFPFWWDAPTHS